MNLLAAAIELSCFPEYSNLAAKKIAALASGARDYRPVSPLGAMNTVLRRAIPTGDVEDQDTAWFESLVGTPE
jgi:hypothetical protein